MKPLLIVNWRCSPCSITICRSPGLFPILLMAPQTSVRFILLMGCCSSPGWMDLMLKSLVDWWTKPYSRRQTDYGDVRISISEIRRSLDTNSAMIGSKLLPTFLDGSVSKLSLTRIPEHFLQLFP